MSESAPGTSLSLAEIEVTYPASFEHLGEARDAVERAARRFGFDEAGCFQIKVAVSEAVANAIEHGSPRGFTDEISMRCVVEDGDFVVYINDHGKFHNQIGPGEGMRERGRGLSFMGTLMDEVDIRLEEGGTGVRLVKKRR